MKSFHGKQKIKDKYLNRLKEHRKMDEIIKGVYWQNGKGCAVGCTVHSYSHNAYEKELGIPSWLAYLEDQIFEGLPNGKAKDFPVNFLSAIPVGVEEEDFTCLKHKFLYWLLAKSQKSNTGRNHPVVKKSIQDITALHLRESKGEKVTNREWSAAKSTAESAESAAISATYSAARSAAESAARSAAESAAWSARSAAESAESAARSAARSAAWSAESAAESEAYEEMAVKLVSLLKGLKEGK